MTWWFRAWGFALLVVALLLVVGSAAATTGGLDPSFGTSGTVTTGLVGPVGDSPANALLLQPDGKLIAVGDSDANPTDGQDPLPQISLVRYNPDGSWDPGFGSYGVVRTTIPGGNAYANAALLQPDGKIVVAGYYWPNGRRVFALLRYDADGSLDPSFGTGGIVTTPVGDDDSEAFGVVLQPDGKIVAGGLTNDSNGSNSRSALVRYNPDGTLDASFGSDGIVLDTHVRQHGFAAIALQPDGKILGVGQGALWPWTATPLTRFNSDGTPDSSFGSGGVSKAATGQADALTLQPDGKIVVVGENANSFSVTRVDPDGTADPSFGSGGTVTTPMGPGFNEASAVALQPDAKVVVAGPSQGGLTIVRYDQDGSLDPTFGRGAIVTTLNTTACPCWANAGATSMVLQPDGKIDAAGWAAIDGGPGDQLTLARYLGSGGGMLTVQKLGTGTGSVSSDPIGVDCGATCTDLFAPEQVTLTATPAAGSVFTGWSGACSGTETCQVQMSADETVAATFSLTPEPPACIAPRTKGKSLENARRLIKQAHCRTGTVKHSFSNVNKNHVISQTPGHGRHLLNGARINLRVSKGGHH